jgi:hypothetical protein
MVSAPSPLPPLNPELFPAPPPPVSQQPGPPAYTPPAHIPPAYTPPAYTPPVYTATPQPVVPQPPPMVQALPPNDPGQTRIITAPPVAPRGPVVAVLIGIGGRLIGDVYKIHDGENRMGRLRTADIALDARDDTISREHALILHQNGAFGLKPLRSDNPTFVNGEPIEDGTPLSDGDQIKVGQSTFRFRTA